MVQIILHWYKTIASNWRVRSCRIFFRLVVEARVRMEEGSGRLFSGCPHSMLVWWLESRFPRSVLSMSYSVTLSKQQIVELRVVLRIRWLDEEDCWRGLWGSGKTSRGPVLSGLPVSKVLITASPSQLNCVHCKIFQETSLHGFQYLPGRGLFSSILWLLKCFLWPSFPNVVISN